MNRIFQPCAEALLFRMSDNAERYPASSGSFKVTYGRHLTKMFPSLLEAFLFYITLDEAADLWNVTDEVILIEQKVMMHLN